MKILSALLGFILIIVALIFALSNRQNVELSLWPFDVMIAAPLYIMTLGALGFGLLLGGGFVWLGTLQHKYKARHLAKDVVTLSDKILQLEEELKPHRARLAAETPPRIAGPKWRFWERWKASF